MRPSRGRVRRCGTVISQGRCPPDENVGKEEEKKSGKRKSRKRDEEEVKEEMQRNVCRWKNEERAHGGGEG